LEPLKILKMDGFTTQHMAGFTSPLIRSMESGHGRQTGNGFGPQRNNTPSYFKQISANGFIS
jgi:hypothetical protein